MILPVWVRVCRHAEPRRQRALRVRRRSRKGGCAAKGLGALALYRRRVGMDFSLDMDLKLWVRILLTLFALAIDLRAHEAKHGGEAKKTGLGEW